MLDKLKNNVTLFVFILHIVVCENVFLHRIDLAISAIILCIMIIVYQIYRSILNISIVRSNKIINEKSCLFS